MKTITYYNFEESTEENQKKAIEANFNINTDYDWYDYTIEEWTETLSDIGFESTTIEFSGFSSQGDGACFKCKEINFEKLFSSMIMCDKISGIKLDRLMVLINLCSFNGSIYKSSNFYSHENTVSLDFNYDMFLAVPERNIIEDSIIEYARDIMREIYKSLESEYEYLTSDEQIKETLISNGYDFDKNGEIV